MSHFSNLSPAITLEALTVLDAIAQRGSFAKAAEQLNKVPSALSYIVQKLEEQLSVTLFIRQGRRSVLTPAGKHLLSEGRKLLEAANKLSEQTQTIANGWEPKLKIAVDSIVDLLPVFNCIQQFIELHPNIEIDISEEVLNGTWESLIDDRVDLLIGAAPPIPTQEGISARQWAEINNVFVVHKNHPLTDLNVPITEDILANYQTVVTHDTAKHVTTWNIGIIKNSRHLYVPTIDYKIKAILAGLGGGFLPTNRIVDHLDTGELVAIDIERKQSTLELFIAWKTANRGKGLSNLREQLLSSI